MYAKYLMECLETARGALIARAAHMRWMMDEIEQGTGHLIPGPGLKEQAQIMRDWTASVEYWVDELDKELKRSPPAEVVEQKEWVDVPA